MLAGSMVAVRGLPILPSGLFYDHGLLQSMLSGLFIALCGFREEIARWPTLLAGVVLIAVYYTTAHKLFASRLTGLLAAAVITFDGLAIQWAAWARMYTFAHLFVLLCLTWLLKSVFQAPHTRDRYFFLVFLAGAFLSHTITFAILPPLAILSVVLTLFYSRRWLQQRQIWRQAGLGLLLMIAVLLIVGVGQISSTVNYSRDSQTAASSLPQASFLAGFFSPSLAWSRFDDLTFFFFEFPYNWYILLIGLALLTVLYHFQQKQATFADWAFCFLLVYIVLVVFEMGSLLTSVWQKPRYLFMLNLPAFLLLAAESLSRLLRVGTQGLLKPTPLITRRCWINAALPLVGILFVVGLLGPDFWDIAQAQGVSDYNTAFKFVRDNWQEGDKIMTVHPSAAYLYLGRNDYYANQVTAKVLPDEDDPAELVDRYTGAPLVDSVEKLNAVLAGEKRLWFVVDYRRLYRRYEPLFTQQIFAQMTHAPQIEGVYVFVSKPFPRPLPAAPDVSLDAQFGQVVRLEGYTLNFKTLAPDGSLPLHLYWRPLELPRAPFKIFVQLRNRQGQNIAQADHFTYENLLNGQEWQDLKNNGEWLRETALLQLPLPLSPAQGPYHLFIGLYDPNTFERVPLANDTSGENAVLLPFSP